MDGIRFLDESWSADIFPAGEPAPEQADIFAPLPSPTLSNEVRGLVEKAFKDTTKAHGDRLCALLEHHGFHSLALLAHLHRSVGLSLDDPTAAESNLAKEVRHILCGG